jgi:uncharacterized OB-fold protein
MKNDLGGNRPHEKQKLGNSKCEKCGRVLHSYQSREKGICGSCHRERYGNVFNRSSDPKYIPKEMMP